jgi:hypothetical protein
MAVCMLGLGHDRASDHCAGWFYSRVGGHRQVYQVDQVQANHNAFLQIEWLPSSMTSCTILVSPTPSLRIWDPISTRISSGISVNAMAHLRANGQVERANGLILYGLKKRLYDQNSKKDGKWINKISSVIWRLRT